MKLLNAYATRLEEISDRYNKGIINKKTLKMELKSIIRELKLIIKNT